MGDLLLNLIRQRINYFQEMENNYNQDAPERRIYQANRLRWQNNGYQIAHNIKLNGEITNNIAQSVSLFTGRKVVNMAFGQSLRKQTRTIRKIIKKYPDVVITGVDRGYNWYRRKGINPDITYAIDPHIDYCWLFTDNDSVPGNHDYKLLIAHIETNNLFVTEWIKRGGSVFFITGDNFGGTDDDLQLFGRSVLRVQNFPNVGGLSTWMNGIVLKSKVQYLCGHDYSYNNYYYPNQMSDKYQKNNGIKTNDGKYSTKALIMQAFFENEAIRQTGMNVIDCSNSIMPIKKSTLFKEFK